MNVIKFFSDLSSESPHIELIHKKGLNQENEEGEEYATSSMEKNLLKKLENVVAVKPMISETIDLNIQYHVSDLNEEKCCQLKERYFF